MNEINIEKLNKGMVVKNYKELCGLVQADVKAGKSKQLQLKRFKQWFDFEKEKHKNSYVILDVHSTPIEISSRYRKSKYLNETKILILKYLMEHARVIKDKYELSTTYSQLYKELAVIKSDFWNLDSFYYDNFSFTQENNITKNQVLYCCSWASHTIRDTIRLSVNNALNQLQKENFIDYKGGHVIVDNKKNHRAADESEEEDILIAEKYAINKVNQEYGKQYITVRDACFLYKNTYGQYYKEYINEHYNWEYTYYRIYIVADKLFVSKKICDFTWYNDDKTVGDLTERDTDKYRISYNKSLMKSYQDKINKRLNKTISNYKRSEDLKMIFDDMTDEEIKDNLLPGDRKNFLIFEKLKEYMQL